MKTAILLFIFIPIFASATEFKLAKNTQCKVFVKASQSQMNLNWYGKCKSGYADGLGVVRYLQGAKVDSVYYGLVAKGFWDLGVLDIHDGYIAGRFKNNELIETKENDDVTKRNELIQAFEIASKAATQLSKEFKRKANPASAKFYQSEAEKLKQQMD